MRRSKPNFYEMLENHPRAKALDGQVDKVLLALNKNRIPNFPKYLVALLMAETPDKQQLVQSIVHFIHRPPPPPPLPQPVKAAPVNYRTLEAPVPPNYWGECSSGDSTHHRAQHYDYGCAIAQPQRDIEWPSWNINQAAQNVKLPTQTDSEKPLKEQTVIVKPEPLNNEKPLEKQVSEPPQQTVQTEKPALEATIVLMQQQLLQLQQQVERQQSQTEDQTVPLSQSRKIKKSGKRVAKRRR